MEHILEGEMKLKNKYSGEVVEDSQAVPHYGWYEQFCGWDSTEAFYSDEDWEEIPES